MADQKDVLAQQPSVWERCARIAERMTEMDQRAMENPNDDLLPAQRQSRIDAAKFIALTIRLAGKQESDGRTPAAVARAKQPCACDWTTGECQGPLGCKAFAEAASRTPAACSGLAAADWKLIANYETDVAQAAVEEIARLTALVESVRRKAQEKSDFWHAQAAKDEAGGGTRAEHYAVVGSQFQNIVSLTSTVRGSDAQT